MKIGALGILFTLYYTSCFYVSCNVFVFCCYCFYGVVQVKPQYVVQQELLLEGRHSRLVLLKGTFLICLLNRPKYINQSECVEFELLAHFRIVSDGKRSGQLYDPSVN